MNDFLFVKNRNKVFWSTLGFLLIALVGFIDLVTGYQYAFSFFYLIPIAIIAWFVNRPLGITASVFSALVWVAADIYAGDKAPAGVLIWNTLIRLCFFIVVTVLLAALRKAYEHEKHLASTDNMTGAVNGRRFMELLQAEIDRQAHSPDPFTIAYIDLDHFKAVNDRYGHAEGDRLLKMFVRDFRDLIRKTDSIARLGGDEFCLLLTQTDERAAKVIIPRIVGRMQELQDKAKRKVTFSTGVLTCRENSSSSYDLIHQADNLMYKAKKAGNGSVQFAVDQQDSEDDQTA